MVLRGFAGGLSKHSRLSCKSRFAGSRGVSLAGAGGGDEPVAVTRGRWAICPRSASTTGHMAGRRGQRQRWTCTAPHRWGKDEQRSGNNNKAAKPQRQQFNPLS